VISIISFLIDAADAEDIRCSDASSNVDFLQYPDCKMENSCVLTNLNLPRDAKINIDRLAHDFKCMIFEESFVYEIPSSIFMTLKSNVTHLYANRVNIAELRRISFPFGQKLQSVNLSENEIRGIKETVFYDTPNLRVLSLSDNKISDFSSNAFEKLNSLKTLDLSRNQIATIPFELFQPLSSIVNLNLRHNRLQIKFGVFPSALETLDLSYNNIDIYHKFKIFSLMDNLTTLLLHGNRIENIHTSILETNLKFIGLSDNPFNCNILADIFLKMRDQNVTSVPDPENIVKNSSNIQGIKCIE
jgi:Leucine-rich repeat (LRR) protein